MYQKILIPLDGSDLAECSLAHAKAIAQGCNVTDVIVFRVIEPFSTQTLAALAEAGDESIRRVRQQNQQDAEDYVLKVKNNLRAQGVASRAVTVEGRPGRRNTELHRKEQRRPHCHEHPWQVRSVALLLRKRSGKGVPPFSRTRPASGA